MGCVKSLFEVFWSIGSKDMTLFLRDGFSDFTKSVFCKNTHLGLYPLSLRKPRPL